ncbi:MAG: flagellar assembly peptidoglycan hydrolase FlgJ [Halothiobacillaceae bacterium]
MNTNLGNYTDLQGLTTLKAQAQQDPRGTLKTVARQFESQFIQMMLSSMRQASPGDPLFDNSQTETFREMYDKEVAQKLSSGPGIGLAEMIERQLEQFVAGGDGDDDGQAREPRFYDLPERRMDLRPFRPIDESAAAPARAEEAAAEAGQGGDESLPSAPATPAAGMPLSRRPPEFSLDDLRTVTEFMAPERPKSAAPPESRQVDRSSQIDWETPEQFAQTLMPHARRAAERLGIDPKVLVAQSALETGWGRHIPKDGAGEPNLNLFGIKADPSWQGPKTRVSTLEFEEGVMVRQQANFRQYDSIGAAFDDYVAFVEQNPRYVKALQAAERGDSAGYVRELQAAGYATDPDYADKILSVMNSGRIPA